MTLLNSTEFHLISGYFWEWRSLEELAFQWRRTEPQIEADLQAAIYRLYKLYVTIQSQNQKSLSA